MRVGQGKGNRKNERTWGGWDDHLIKPAVPTHPEAKSRINPHHPRRRQRRFSAGLFELVGDRLVAVQGWAVPNRRRQSSPGVARASPGYNRRADKTPAHPAASSQSRRPAQTSGHAETCSIAESGRPAGLAVSSKCCRFPPCQFHQKKRTAARAFKRDKE